MRSASDPIFRRADLHVHSHHSHEILRYGRLKTPIQAASAPAKIAQRAMDAGMDYIAITDHDTLDGCQQLLDEHPELGPRVITGEEVTTYCPNSGHELHLSVLGITRRQHSEIQSRRRDLIRLVSYLKREGILYVLNHPIWDAEGRRWSPSRLVELVRLVRDHFPVIEGRNGSVLPYQNRIASAIARRLSRFVIGGSDTHTDQVGYTWTEAPGQTKAAFLQAIRSGKARPGGKECTKPFFTHEVRELLRKNAVRRARPLGKLTGALLGVFIDLFHARLTSLVTQTYLRAQESTLPSADRELELVLPPRS